MNPFLISQYQTLRTPFVTFYTKKKSNKNFKKSTYAHHIYTHNYIYILISIAQHTFDVFIHSLSPFLFLSLISFFSFYYFFICAVTESISEFVRALIIASMAETSRLGRFSSLRAKRFSNLYFLTAGIVLCTICYLIGFWQQAKGNVTTVATGAGDGVVSRPPCSPFRSNLTAASRLDFESHHRAEDLPPAPPAARAIHFPACASELSEYTPCEDAKRSLRFERQRLIYRERHCPSTAEEVLKCRIPAPYGYRTPFRWPESRGLAWYANVPHKELTVEKKNQNWVHYENGRFRFPGGGTMFPRGADAYIDDIGKLIDLEDGSIRTAIDTGCGVRKIFLSFSFLFFSLQVWFGFLLFIYFLFFCNYGFKR